uniref:Uncharacterized protein n=1 Tax=Trichobilharzia regenti TaxID=157069 RepID=A0AA85J0T3_TRIRE|nr:unnamed protein product [Trichobilharzia regenti]
MHMTSLTQPASPQSRRSSSVSTIGLYNTTVSNTINNLNNNISNNNNNLLHRHNSTVVNLYTRQYIQKKKSHRWRLVRTPIPLNPVYRKTLFLAIIMPCIGALLFIGATLTPEWENVHFKFIKILEMFSVYQNCSIMTTTTTSTTDNNNSSISSGYETNVNIQNASFFLNHHNDLMMLDESNYWTSHPQQYQRQQYPHQHSHQHNYTLEFIIFRDGKILNWRKLKNYYKNCLTVTYKMNEIVGIVVHSDVHIPQVDASSSMSNSIHSNSNSHSNTPKHLLRETPVTPRLFNRNKYTFTRQEWIQLVEQGDLLDGNTDDEMNRNLWLIMNLQAGIWTMCFRLSDIYKPKILAYSANIHPESHIPLDCISYLQANLSETKNLCSQFLLKMQNNIISCVVVVYLSVAASVLIGAFSTLFRAVPAAMVTGVLYVTSGVFIIFANCIHHTKLNRLEYEWGPCYPISQIPRTLYIPEIISVHPLWPVLVSWISSFVFFVASIIWIILTQLMTFENSKTMI